MGGPPSLTQADSVGTPVQLHQGIHSVVETSLGGYPFCERIWNDLDILQATFGPKNKRCGEWWCSGRHLAHPTNRFPAWRQVKPSRHELVFLSGATRSQCATRSDLQKAFVVGVRKRSSQTSKPTLAIAV